MACKMGLKERRTGSNGVQRGEGICEKRTRGSFHVCPINVEEHLDHKSEALPSWTLPLCCPGYPTLCPILAANWGTNTGRLVGETL